MSRLNAKIFCFFENSQKTAGFSANGPPKARCSGQKPRHGRADTVFCLGAERGPRPLLFPGRLAQAPPPMHPASALGALFTSVGRESVPQQGRFLCRKAAHSLPTFPPCGVRKMLSPASGRSRLGARRSPCRCGPPLRKKGPCAFAPGPFGMRDASGHCARSIRQTMAEICPRVMVLAGLKVLVPLEK